MELHSVPEALERACVWQRRRRRLRRHRLACTAFRDI